MLLPIIILLLVLLLLVLNHVENFIVNPKFFLGNTTHSIRDLTDYRECNFKKDKTKCISDKKITFTPNRSRLPFSIFRNYRRTHNVAHLFPPSRPIRIPPNS